MKLRKLIKLSKAIKRVVSDYNKVYYSVRYSAESSNVLIGIMLALEALDIDMQIEYNEYNEIERVILIDMLHNTILDEVIR